MSCMERLDRLGHFSLKCKWLRDDLLEMYKIMRGVNKMNSYSLYLRSLELEGMGLRWEGNGFMAT